MADEGIEAFCSYQAMASFVAFCALSHFAG
jgi:hypothetical protein